MKDINKEVIIDTNVPINAINTRKENQLDVLCAMACLRFIKEVMESDKYFVVLDSGNEIYREYYKNISNTSQRTIATQFLNWIQRNLTLRYGSRVIQHRINKIDNNTYEEFPNDLRLLKFDPADRKFVALAAAHPNHPSIFQGSDSLWWGFKDILKEYSIDVVFLCKEYVESKYKGS